MIDKQLFSILQDKILWLLKTIRIYPLFEFSQIVNISFFKIEQFSEDKLPQINIIYNHYPSGCFPLYCSN